MYKFTIRPGYQSQNLLIEFSVEQADQKFFDDLLVALKPVNASITSMEGLWMNDEVLLDFASSSGKFILLTL